MSQNLISLKLSDADWADIDAAIGVIETKLGGLITLDAEQRRQLTKMGDRSEAFCRQTLVVLAQNPQVIPPSLDLPEAQDDLGALDALRHRTTRLHQLLGRAEDTEMALGSDVMTASLEGYALLKMMGKGSSLEALRKEISARFARTSKKGSTAAPVDGSPSSVKH
jgi:hypothetical protein